MPHFFRLSSLAICFMLLFPQGAHAQEMMGGKMSCPMCGAMGWGGMILGGVLILSVIAIFVALALFLVRRSRSPHPDH